MNELGNAMSTYSITGPQSVVFTISLEENILLNDMGVVVRCMNELMVQYPRAKEWTATIREGSLFIMVVGDLNLPPNFKG